ncbi:MAG: hypothetical protein R2735_02570 [Microthrixaceae bacterium]
MDHEYLVCFTRRASGDALGLDPNAVATTLYNNEDEYGRYALERLDKQNLQYSASLDYELIGPDSVVYELRHKDPASERSLALVEGSRREGLRPTRVQGRKHLHQEL